MTVRPATEHDIAHLVSFNQAMARETEGRELDAETLRAGVTRLFQRPEYGFYLVAETPDAQIVGGLMITFEWSDWRNGVFWWIQSVYVRPDHRRQGIFRKLYDHVHGLALGDSDVCGFRLYVEKENGIARQTYEKLGMDECDYRMFEWER